MPDPNLSLALLTAFLSTVGALLASWVGTRFGLKQFRSERSYEAQIEWHRTLAQTAKVLSNRSRAIRSFRRMKTPEKHTADFVKDVGALAFSFQEQAEQASLYAKKKTYEAIRIVLKDMNKMSADFSNPSETRSVSEQEKSDDHYEASLLGLGMIYEVLASDLRELQGLEKLDQHKKLDKLIRRGLEK